MDDISLRPATDADLPVINDIYNFYVVHSTCTYQEQIEPIENRRAWFETHGTEHPIIVAELDGHVVGWGALSRYHPRSAYRSTVENSVYIRDGFHRRGIGALLLQELIDRAVAIGHHTIIAIISAEQSASIALHERFGFVEAGRLRELGWKFERWLDVVYLQKLL